MKPNSEIEVEEIRKFNEELVAARLKAWNARSGVRVGDYIRLPVYDERAGEYTRVTEIHPDGLVQTGGCQYGSYHLGNWGMSYSGGLDRGLALEDIEPEPVGTRPGRCWIFSEGRSGAHRGVEFTVDCRVFEPTPGADLSGVREHMPLVQINPYRQPSGELAFYVYDYRPGEREEQVLRGIPALDQWLRQHDLALAEPCDQPQRPVWPSMVGRATSEPHKISPPMGKLTLLGPAQIHRKAAQVLQSLREGLDCATDSLDVLDVILGQLTTLERESLEIISVEKSMPASMAIRLRGNGKDIRPSNP